MHFNTSSSVPRFLGWQAALFERIDRCRDRLIEQRTRRALKLQERLVTAAPSPFREWIRDYSGGCPVVRNLFGNTLRLTSRRTYRWKYLGENAPSVTTEDLEALARAWAPFGLNVVWSFSRLDPCDFWLTVELHERPTTHEVFR